MSTDPAPPVGGATPSPPAGDAPLADARLSLGRAQLDDLFPTGEAFQRSMRTFTVLLTLSAFIATFGLFQDSVAAIIGAMVIAPLGGTIMAFAGALVTARDRWQVLTFVQVVVSAVWVIIVAVFVSWFVPDTFYLTPAVEARTAPGILDLGVAIAAGAAGAYVAVRRTGTDALPGVAIAVSLVPPLATVGICLELGRLDDAVGALWLFVTNFAAITVSAGIVFAFAGAVPAAALRERRHRVRNSFVGALVALCIIAVPLVLTGVDRAISMLHEDAAAPIVRDWIGDRDIVVTSWSVEGRRVTLILRGPDVPADAKALADALTSVFDGPVELDLVYTPSTHVTVTSGS